MADPTKHPRRDEELVRKLHDEQSEANDADDFLDTHAADLTIENEPDTSPENT